MPETFQVYWSVTYTLPDGGSTTIGGQSKRLPDTTAVERYKRALDEVFTIGPTGSMHIGTRRLKHAP